MVRRQFGGRVAESNCGTVFARWRAIIRTNRPMHTFPAKPSARLYSLSSDAWRNLVVLGERGNVMMCFVPAIVPGSDWIFCRTPRTPAILGVSRTKEKMAGVTAPRVGFYVVRGWIRDNPLGVFYRSVGSRATIQRVWSSIPEPPQKPKRSTPTATGATYRPPRHLNGIGSFA